MSGTYMQFNNQAAVKAAVRHVAGGAGGAGRRATERKTPRT